jgi:hypothetical protein
MDYLARAGEFFSNQGREIDRARFRCHFGDGSPDEVVAALAPYQNQDGGFGHALEPDITAPDSNPFATELALHICLEAAVSAEHPLVSRTVTYLEEAQDEDGNWRFSPCVYQHQLAPWFQGWTWPSLNPSCTLAGLLRQYGLGSDRLHRRVEALFARLANPADLAGDAYYAVRPYAYYFWPDWDHPRREFYLSGVLWWLIRQEANGALPDAGHFFEYVGGPRTYVGRLLPEQIIGEQLDRLTAEQEEDGGWPSPYSDAWRGHSTVEALLTLQRFGRRAA